MSRPTRPTAERFWEKVEKTSSCWNWTAYVSPDGYGLFRYEGATASAHRVAYRLAHSEIPAGMQIDHTCHNRSCVNPNHLRPVTNKQNQENRTGATARSRSGVRGVSWNKRRGRWLGTVRHNQKDMYVGYFDSIEAAETAVVALRNELFTHNDADKNAA